MSERTRLLKDEDKDAVYIMDVWTDNNYVYFSYDISSKKGRSIDVITEQSTQVLPEIVAKQIFWDRLKGRLVSDITPYLKKAGVNTDIEYVGEPELRLSNTLKQGSGLGKLFAAVSYDFHHWALIGCTVVFRVTK